jgi:hypothetical protein
VAQGLLAMVVVAAGGGDPTPSGVAGLPVHHADRDGQADQQCHPQVNDQGIPKPLPNQPTQVERSIYAVLSSTRSALA